MPKLFCDCDDTLVLWLYEEKVVDGYTYFTIPNEGEKYRVNHQLILAIHDYLTAHLDTILIVWSGGGAEYAGSWARKFFDGVSRVDGIEMKNVKYPQAGDICIDDQQLVLNPGVTLMTWQEFVGEYTVVNP